MGIVLHVKLRYEPRPGQVYETVEEGWEETRCWLRVEPDERAFREITPAESLRRHNHSPTGFSWGYEGSGPAQLAFAILLAGVDPAFAEKHYQRFKREVIGRIAWNPGDAEFTLNVERWLRGEEGAFRVLAEA